MIKISVLYPNPANCEFDFDYYCTSHLPMLRDRLGQACQGIAVDKGISGEPDSPPPYAAVVHLYFDSAQAFQDAFAPHAEEILADMPNYTNVQPVVQLSEVVINATRGQTGELHLHTL